MSNIFLDLPTKVADAITTVETAAALPTGVPEGSVRYVKDTDTIYQFDGTSWTAMGGGGGGGDVNGPGASTDNALVRWDGTAGVAIQNSAATLDDAGALTVARIGAGTSPTLSITAALHTYTDPTGDEEFLGLNDVRYTVADSGFKQNQRAKTFMMNPSGTLSLVAGYTSTMEKINAGNVNQAIGFYSKISNNDPDAVVGAATGLYIATGSGNIDNKFGVYQEDPAARSAFYGAVGIGTESPGAKLTVNRGSAFATLWLGETDYATVDNEETAQNLKFTTYAWDGDDGASISSTMELRFTQLSDTDNVARFDITKAGGTPAISMYNSNGKVGIGTTNPSARLSIVDEASTGISTSVPTGSAHISFIGADSNTIGIGVPDEIDSPYILVLPTDPGLDGQVLTTNGTGVSSWSSIATTELVTKSFTPDGAGGVPVSMDLRITKIGSRVTVDVPAFTATLGTSCTNINSDTPLGAAYIPPVITVIGTFPLNGEAGGGVVSIDDSGNIIIRKLDAGVFGASSSGLLYSFPATYVANV